MLQEKQYNKIIKYWAKIEKLEKKIAKYSKYISNFDNFEEPYNGYLDMEDVDNTIDKLMTYRRALETYEMYQNELQYIKDEYEKYIYKLGYQFSDISQDEKLFQLINNGIII